MAAVQRVRVSIAQDEALAAEDEGELAAKLSVIGLFAIFAIGIAACCGAFHGHDIILAGTTLSIAVAVGLITLFSKLESKGKILMIFVMAVFTVLGALATAGLLDCWQLGKAIVITNSAFIGILCIVGQLSPKVP